MILLTHIALALTSIVLASYTALFPSSTKLRITYVLSIGTILSGLTMAFINPVNLGRACLSGIVYLGLIISISAIAQKRLAKF
jgi:hypothetical protein